MTLGVEQTKSWFRKRPRNNATPKDLEGVGYTNDQGRGQALSHGLRFPEYLRQRLSSLLPPLTPK